VLIFLVRDFAISRFLSERLRTVDLALAGDRERLSDHSFLNPVRPNAVHTDLFPSRTFRRLDTDALQIRVVISLGDARRFSTVTTEILGFSALCELIASPWLFTANVANP
jgi:hypothetical protein